MICFQNINVNINDYSKQKVKNKKVKKKEVKKINNKKEIKKENKKKNKNVKEYLLSFNSIFVLISLNGSISGTSSYFLITVIISR